MKREEMNRKMSQLIAKVWADEEFKERLMGNSEETLKEEGIEMPEGMKVNVVENTAEVFNLVIPVKPAEISEELSDEDLDQAAGGFFCQCGGCFTTADDISPPPSTCKSLRFC